MQSLMKVVCFLLIASIHPATLAQTPIEPPPAKLNTQDQPVRLNTQLIQVHAVITDRQGRAVTDLTKEDFELLENDRPQPVSFFALEKIGSQKDAPATPAPAVVDKAASPGLPPLPPLPPRPPSRTIVLFTDTLHLSKTSLPTVKATLRKFVDEQMTGDDLVALITSTGQLGPLEQFTRDKHLLRLAIDRLILWNESSRKSLMTAYLAAQVINGDPESFNLAYAILQAEESSHIPPAYPLMASHDIVNLAASRRKTTLQTLSAVARQMAELPGQRLIVLLSDGFSTFDASGSQEPHALDSAISSAVRSGVIIYSLAASGLRPDFFLGDASLPRQTAVVLAKYSTLIAESRRDGEYTLQDLAKGTGGEAFVNTNDLSGKLQRALNDNRIFYTLAFYPSNARPDAGFRHITVRLKSHPAYSVRAQRGYLPLEIPKEAVAKTPKQKMLQALAAPLPLTGLAVTALADFLEWEADDAQVSLQVFIDGQGFDYAKPTQARSLSLELAGVIVDLTGKTVDSFSDKIAINLLPARARQAEQNGFCYLRRLHLKPGQYQARVAVRESGSEPVGTATTWITVPDLRKNGLTLSGISITARPAARAKESATVKGDDLFAPKVAQGIRTYRINDILVYYVMLYGAPAGQPSTSDLTMQIEVTQGERAIYKSEWQPVNARVIASHKKGIGVSGQLQLRLNPGTYELHITISHPAAHQTAQQSVIFAVEPGAASVTS
jgi:VWFA-related protein